MANICSCCGKKVPMLDVGFDLIEIDEKEYYLCSDCNSRFHAFKRGDVSYIDLITESTKQEMKDYFCEHMPDSETVEESQRYKEKMQQKVIARENEPLYEDIHQIAGDLRFIKNLIIVGLVCSFLLGILIGISML